MFDKTSQSTDFGLPLVRRGQVKAIYDPQSNYNQFKSYLIEFQLQRKKYIHSIFRHEILPLDAFNH